MNDHQQQGVGRREFLIMTSGTVLAAVAMGQVNLPSSSAAGRMFSLGYADPDAVTRAGARFTPNVMSADRVSSSDGGFLRGVRVSVRGYNVTPKAAGGRKSMQLITNFAAVDGTGKVYPFIAWSYTPATGAGHNVSYTAQLDQEQHLRLIFKTDLSASQAADPTLTPAQARTRRNLFSTLVSESAAADTDAVTLSLVGEKGLPKLQRGYYIIAPLAAGSSDPDWSRFQIKKGESGLKLFVMNGFDAEPADFEYLILQVDMPEAPDPGKPERVSKTK
jgi:hypothetical protein